MFCERGSIVELLTFVCTDLVRGQYQPFFLILVFFSFLFFFNLKLPIMPFSYFVIQFNIKKHEKNMVELLDCLILLSIT